MEFSRGLSLTSIHIWTKASFCRGSSRGLRCSSPCRLRIGTPTMLDFCGYGGIMKIRVGMKEDNISNKYTVLEKLWLNSKLLYSQSECYERDTNITPTSQARIFDSILLLLYLLRHSCFAIPWKYRRPSLLPALFSACACGLCPCLSTAIPRTAESVTSSRAPFREWQSSVKRKLFDTESSSKKCLRICYLTCSDITAHNYWGVNASLTPSSRHLN